MTLRARAGLPPFREQVLGGVIRGAVGAGSRDSFRVVQFSIQRDHLHFVVEAHDATALARGMQGLAVRVARAVNGLVGTRGRVFRERYHARELTTPRAVRNAIVYVLMNARKHGSRLATGVDALSSAPWFDGFAAKLAPPASESPVRAARTWLAGVGWPRRGLVRLDERPRDPT